MGQSKKVVDFIAQCCKKVTPVVSGRSLLMQKAKAALRAQAVVAAHNPLMLVYTSYWPDGAILTLEAYRTLCQLQDPPEHAVELEGEVAGEVAKVRGLPFIGTLELNHYIGQGRKF